MGFLRLCGRGIFASVYTAWVVAWMRLLNLFLGKNYHRNLRMRRRWARVVLKYCGIQMTVNGEIPTSTCILVVNHRSWLDPLLLLRDVLAFPVAKAEMANWPLLGSGARLGGIIYVHREDSGSRLSTLRQMAIQLKAGHSIMIFPEGTTSDLDGTLPFKTGAFQVAAKMNIAVVPVALLYADKADFWVGDESFSSHASRRFSQKNMVVKVHYGPVLHNRDADALCKQSHEWLEAELKKHSSGL